MVDENSAAKPRDTWRRACERYDSIARGNPHFSGMSEVVRVLASRPCADVTFARMDGVDLYLARVLPTGEVERVAVADARDHTEVRLRALIDGAIEVRWSPRGPRTRANVRLMAVAAAPAEIERCLWEIGWVPESAWRDWR